MRILVTNENRGFGGGELYTLDLCQGLRARGHEVCLAARRDSWLAEQARQADLETVTMGFSSELDPITAARLRALVHTRETQVVHAQATRDLVLAAVGLVGSGCRLIKSEHTFLGSSRSALLNWAYARSHQVVAPSQALAEQMLRECPGLGGRISVVANGLDLELYHGYTAPPPPEMTEGTWVGCVASLIPGKGQADLLQAFAALATDHPDLRLALAGAGSLREELGQQATQLGISERVWWAGQVADPRPILSHSRVVVVPSHSETFSLVCLQAMALGRPLLACRVGGVPELVGDTARLVDSGQSQALAAALAELLCDPVGSEQLGQRARERSRLYSLGAMLTHLETLYRGCERPDVTGPVKQIP